ncbi:collagenase [Kitasatospora sp. NBC_00070]|uniref:collagenase n=1 Tax=Kitasatospora sp. NBC_00070 TaxID=2975962 RepID=UPI00324619E1
MPTDLLRLLIAALVCCLGATLFASTAQAAAGGRTPAPTAKPARPGVPPLAAATRLSVDAEAESAEQSVSLAQRAPFRAASPAERAVESKYGLPAQQGPAALAVCSVGDFTSRTGSALVAQIKSSSTDCVNSLFGLKGADATAAFGETQMVTVANALRAVSVNYPGNNSTSAAQLVTFLRAGYFVQWYNPETVGSYGSTLQTAIRGALDAFYGNAHSRDVTESNGATLAEAVTLIDSAQENARYLPVVKRLLSGYNSSYDSSYSMLLAVNNSYTVLWRGHQADGFVAAVQADPSVLTTLRDFAVTNDALLGTGNGYLTANAGRELGRFLQHSELRSTVRPLVKELLGRSSITGRTAQLWVGLAESTDDYDAADCAYYDTCDLASRLRDRVLTIHYTCSPSIDIVAQQMTDAELAASCTSLRNQDAYFHSVVKDRGPVAGDLNSTIEVVVFDSSADYKTYAGKIFGISTDNGGMYLEGNPATAGNQPRFIAHEAEWLRPDFQIWNLNHEYTHYLDGRFDMAGDFNAGVTTPTIWWVEGFAEFVSYTYRGVAYDNAVTQAGQNTYKLSTLFNTTYDNSDSTRVYNWGYLAVRYMLQSHRADVDTILGYYRAGNWAAARTLLTSTIGTRYDADFAAWLAACAAGNCGTVPPANQAPTAGFTAATTGLSAAFTDTSTDPDGTIAARSWNFGDGTAAATTTTNPAKSYSAAGTYTVTLTVTDNNGATATTSKAITVAALGAAECAAPDSRELGRNCKRSNLSATTGNYSHLYLNVPAGTTQLTITTTGGTGDADLYYSANGWATTANQTASSRRSDNSETITVTNPPTGTVYLSLYAYAGFGGVSVTASF